LFHSKPLLPFQEWNIDFSELTVGARVGIGKHQYLHFSVVFVELLEYENDISLILDA
jgi:hypothetical protein